MNSFNRVRTRRAIPSRINAARLNVLPSCGIAARPAQIQFVNRVIFLPDPPLRDVLNIFTVFHWKSKERRRDFLADDT